MTSQADSQYELFGKIEEETHFFDVRIYYEDTDFTGVVYHANYLKFMERARSNFLHLLGIRHHELLKGKFDQPLVFTLRNVTIDFLKPASIDEVLQVRTKCTETKGASIRLLQEIWRGTDQLTSGEVNVIVVDSSGKPRRVPNEICSYFSELKE